MQTIQPLRPENVSGPARRILETLNYEHGGLSNMLRTMAHSPETLQAYLHFNRELEDGPLGPMLVEKIALSVAQVDESEYSLARHTVRAWVLGISEEEILSIREGRVADKKTEAALRFARGLARRTGDYSITELRNAGYSDADIVSIIACVGLNSFANLFNAVTKTELDFPKVVLATQAA